MSLCRKNKSIVGLQMSKKKLFKVVARMDGKSPPLEGDRERFKRVRVSEGGLRITRIRIR